MKQTFSLVMTAAWTILFLQSACDSAENDRTIPQPEIKQVIEEPSDSEGIDQTKEAVAELEWVAVKEEDSYESYARFMKDHFPSPHWKEALERTIARGEEKRKELLQKLGLPGDGPSDSNDLAAYVNSPVIPVPATEYLLGIQEIIHPGMLKTADKPDPVYLVYSYERGQDLQSSLNNIPSMTPESQEVICTADIFFRGKRISHRRGFAGEGPGDISDLCQNAIQEMKLPGNLQKFLLYILRPAMGFGAHLLNNRQIQVEGDNVPLGVRYYAAWMRPVILSPHWADRARAGGNLIFHAEKLKDPQHTFLVKDAFHTLFEASKGSYETGSGLFLTLASCIAGGELNGFLGPSEMEKLFSRLSEIVQDPETRKSAVFALVKLKPSVALAFADDGAKAKIDDAILQELKRLHHDNVTHMRISYDLVDLFALEPANEKEKEILNEVYRLALWILEGPGYEDMAMLSMAMETLKEVKGTKGFKALDPELTKRAVPGLIFVLEGLKADGKTVLDEYTKDLLIDPAHQALKALTGQDLGKDAREWRAWIETQKTD